MDFRINLTQAAGEIHQWSRSHGFWDHEMITVEDHHTKVYGLNNPSIASEKIALMHSEELSEALESERDGDTNTAEEMADTIIRILDFCGWRGYDIHRILNDKVEKNRHRPIKHGRKF
jgi:NTP pyrophosphatase (non-canonical NTP hydrolase)